MKSDLKFISNALELAQKKGCYSLSEAANIVNSIENISNYYSRCELYISKLDVNDPVIVTEDVKQK